MPEQIDFEFRPESYSQPLPLSTYLRTTLRGVRRRVLLEKYIASGQLDRNPELVLQALLPAGEQQIAERLESAWKGVVTLAEPPGQEIEIARITVQSTIWDVTAVYASRTDDGYRYRVVDEHDGATLERVREHRWSHPLCLGQLINFFLDIFRLDRCIELNFADDPHPEKALSFASGESAFYPEFGRFIFEEIEDWVNAELYRRALLGAEDNGTPPPTQPIRRGLPRDPMQAVADALEEALAALSRTETSVARTPRIRIVDSGERE
jgi:hypothetical protein